MLSWEKNANFMYFLCYSHLMCSDPVQTGMSLYTDQNYKQNTFVFAPIFHELNSKI